MRPARRALPYLLLALAAGFLVLGIGNGEAAIVFTRAANLCLECIGIG
jgi:hypothetical protein